MKLPRFLGSAFSQTEPKIRNKMTHALQINVRILMRGRWVSRHSPLRMQFRMRRPRTFCQLAESQNEKQNEEKGVIANLSCIISESSWTSWVSDDSISASAKVALQSHKWWGVHKGTDLGRGGIRNQGKVKLREEPNHPRNPQVCWYQSNELEKG